MHQRPIIPKTHEQPSMFDGLDIAPIEKLTCWTPCSPREVLKSEAQLEETLLRDPSALAIISELVGVDFARIGRQVRTGRSLAQRADLVAIGSSPDLPVIVIELMVPALNNEHVTRPIGFAVSLQAKNIVLVAESFPQSTLNLLGVMRSVTDKLGITVHLIKLEAFKNLHGKSAYSLRPLTPRKAPEHRQTFLESLIQRVGRQGDDSLLNCTVSEGKRLESYQRLGNLARIRIYSGHGNARISSMLLGDEPWAS